MGPECRCAPKTHMYFINPGGQRVHQFMSNIFSMLSDSHTFELFVLACGQCSFRFFANPFLSSRFVPPANCLFTYWLRCGYSTVSGSAKTANSLRFRRFGSPPSCPPSALPQPSLRVWYMASFQSRLCWLVFLLTLLLIYSLWVTDAHTR